MHISLSSTECVSFHKKDRLWVLFLFTLFIVASQDELPCPTYPSCPTGAKFRFFVVLDVSDRSTMFVSRIRLWVESVRPDLGVARPLGCRIVAIGRWSFRQSRQVPIIVIDKVREYTMRVRREKAFSTHHDVYGWESRKVMSTSPCLAGAGRAATFISPMAS